MKSNFHKKMSLGKGGLIVLIASVALVAGQAFGKTASCPCGKCPCSPCTCGGGGGGSKSGGGKSGGGGIGKSKSGEGGKSASKHHGDDHHHKHGGTEVGVGVNLDLGGIGHQRREADPFAVPSGPATNVSRTEEKPKTKKKDTAIAKSDPFGNVDLTGKKAKNIAATDGEN